jgi:hypothetical protein
VKVVLVKMRKKFCINLKLKTMKKLTLNKKTIARLDNPDKIFGGGTLGYEDTIVQEWFLREYPGVHSDYYCGIKTAATNCACKTLANCQTIQVCPPTLGAGC